jgi:signal transduction histidine kinase
VEGEPQELPTQQALALYRTAQEALANARKHAPGAPVDLQLSWREGVAQLEVVNETSDPHHVLHTSGAGRGLTGLAERAATVGAHLDTGPSARGFRVALTIPLQREG